MHYKRRVLYRWEDGYLCSGFGHAMASKFTIQEINENVKQWLLNNRDPKIEKFFDEIFRDDDDIFLFGVDCMQKMMIMMRIL